MHAQTVEPETIRGPQGQHIASRMASAVWWVPIGLWAKREFALLAVIAVAATAIWGFAELAGEVLEATLTFDERILLALRSATTPRIRSARAGSRS